MTDLFTLEQIQKRHSDMPKSCRDGGLILGQSTPALQWTRFGMLAVEKYALRARGASMAQEVLPMQELKNNQRKSNHAEI